MTRKDYLTYCSVCTNRKFTHEFGFICGLTEKKADFEDECKHFKLDREQRQIRNKTYRDEVDSNIEKRKGFLTKILSSDPQLDYLVNSKPTIDKIPLDKTKETIVMELRKKKGFLLGAIILFPLLIAYSMYDNNLKIQGNELYILACLPIEAILIYWFLRNDEIFRLGSKGVIIKRNEFIPWHKIHFIYLKTTKQDFGDAISLILKIDDLDDREIRIEEADREVEQITSLTYQYIKECKRN